MKPTPTAYETLLLDYLPRPIRSKAAYDEALRRVEELICKPHLGRPESEMVELLATLIEHYESAEHPTPRGTPAQILAHLLAARGSSRAQLARELGMARSAITNILAGRRAISKANALKLSKHFGVSLRLFIEGS